MFPDNFLDLEGEFTWSFGEQFFVETAHGNYVWSDPEYNGDNTIRKFNGTYKKWCSTNGIPFGRAKGNHIIRDYVGDEVKLVNT